MRTACATAIVAALLFSVPALAQDDLRAWTVQVGLDYVTTPDVTYSTSNGYDSKLDVYAARDKSKPRPTVIFIHGGGWVSGDKDASTLQLLPYLQMGFAAVNVEYRLSREALAPAAVEDGRCALRWVIRNAETYGFDTERIVVTGRSAGGHLALTTGMLPSSAGLDRRCPVRLTDGKGPADTKEVEMPVAAIVNWFGITDVGDLLEGENAKVYAVDWTGSMTDRMEVAKRVSPLNYVRKDLPAILTLHGDADPIVPYDHAVRLHKKLEAVGATHTLHTIPGGGHGVFTPEQHQEAYSVIRSFLQDVFNK